jgi:cold shock CspA family protein
MGRPFRRMLSMTGRITRLIDDQQFGTIAAEDGQDYVFGSMALSQTKFSDLSLGALVTFEPIKGPKASSEHRATADKIKSSRTTAYTRKDHSLVRD